MQLRYSGNIMPFEDSMKKVSAITWASSGKKLAIAAADRVIFCDYSVGLFVWWKRVEKGQVPDQALGQGTEILLDKGIGVLSRFVEDSGCSEWQHSFHIQDRTWLGWEKSHLQQVPRISISHLYDLAQGTPQWFSVWFGWRQSQGGCAQV